MAYEQPKPYQPNQILATAAATTTCIGIYGSCMTPGFLADRFFMAPYWGYRMFVYIIDHIYFTNNGSTKIMSMSFCTVFIQVIRGRPGGLFQYTEGKKVKICFASTLSSIRAICLNRVRHLAWIISVSRGWLVWCQKTTSNPKRFFFGRPVGDTA